MRQQGRRALHRLLTLSFRSLRAERLEFGRLRRGWAGRALQLAWWSRTGPAT